jgi:hypothetical protein
MLEDKLIIPIEQQGYIDMYNGIDVLQTRDYIKISCKLFVEKCCEKYLMTWMKMYMMPSVCPTPLPTDPMWIKKFNHAIGDPDTKIQAKLAKEMQLSYRSGVGELIWAMTTCHPDLAYASVKLSQLNHCPHEYHYHGLRHALKYLYVTKDDGIYFWHMAPWQELKEGLLPIVQSNKQNLLMDSDQSDTVAHTLHAYADSDRATCPKTRHSFGDVCLQLAGG